MSVMSEPAGKRPASWWIPWTFVGLFGVVILVNGIMLFFALDTWTGIETEEAFVKGLAYNEQIEAAEAQQALGWQTELAIDRETPGRAAIDLTLQDRNGQALERAEVTAHLVRPTVEGHDLTAQLERSGPGTYSAVVEPPLPGIWDLQIEIRHSSGSYRLSERLQIK